MLRLFLLHHFFLIFITRMSSLYITILWFVFMIHNIFNSCFNLLLAVSLFVSFFFWWCHLKIYRCLLHYWICGSYEYITENAPVVVHFVHESIHRRRNEIR